MAVDILSDISAALSQRYAPDLARQYNRVTMLASAIESEGSEVVGNAKNVAWDVLLGDVTGGFGQTANAYNDGTVMEAAEFTTDAIVPATLAWGLYRNGFSVSDQEFDAAFVSQGSATRIADKLLKERILSASSMLMSQQNIDLWSGTGSATSGVYVGAPNIIGMFGGALAVGGTYAGISASTYASWNSNVLANGGVPRPLTFDLIAQLESEIFNACSEKPDLIVMSTNVWRKYSALFEPERRFNDAQSVYNTSVDKLMWRGIEVIRDKDAPEGPNGCLLMLNKRHVKKAYLAPTQPSREDVWKVQDESGKGFNGDKLFTDNSVPVRVIPLGRTGDFSQYMVKSTVQLKVTRRNSMGTISDIQI